MREILFRGKLYDGKWAEGFLDKGRSGRTYILTNVDVLLVNPDTVGQYTGLTDKNGKKIFELDIVLGRFEFGMKVPSLVVFHDGAFGLEWARAGKTVFTAFTGFCNVAFEVIGNVFDNPELLNKEA